MHPVLVLAALAVPAAPAPYDIPLWPEGKVPLAAGTGPLDAPFVTAFLPPPTGAPAPPWSSRRAGPTSC